MYRLNVQYNGMQDIVTLLCESIYWGRRLRKSLARTG